MIWFQPKNSQEYDTVQLQNASARKWGGGRRRQGAELAAAPRMLSWAPCSAPCWATELQELVSVRSHATSPDLLLHPGHTTNHEYLQREQSTRSVLP